VQAQSSLQTIVYISSATMLCDDVRMAALLQSARTANKSLGITGVLLCAENKFIQCIEGRADAIASTWIRIRQSHLHGGILTLVDSPITERRFSEWEMGFARPDNENWQQLTTANWQNTVQTRDSPGLMLLHSFWKHVHR
jgi:Sensors of blue-light using FAD